MEVDNGEGSLGLTVPYQLVVAVEPMSILLLQGDNNALKALKKSHEESSNFSSIEGS